MLARPGTRPGTGTVRASRHACRAGASWHCGPTRFLLLQLLQFFLLELQVLFSFLAFDKQVFQRLFLWHIITSFPLLDIIKAPDYLQSRAMYSYTQSLFLFFNPFYSPLTVRFTVRKPDCKQEHQSRIFQYPFLSEPTRSINPLSFNTLIRFETAVRPIESFSAMLL